MSPQPRCPLTPARCLPRSRPAVWLDGEVPSAPHSLHQPAAPGAGEPVQAQQVPVQTQALRGGHVTDAHRDAGTLVLGGMEDGTSWLPGRWGAALQGGKSRSWAMLTALAWLPHPTALISTPSQGISCRDLPDGLQALLL